jgi:hypothetical protein
MTLKRGRSGRRECEKRKVQRCRGAEETFYSEPLHLYTSEPLHL